VVRLQVDQIILVDWKDSPLHARVGDEITLSYFPPEHQGPPQERTARFRLAGTLPLKGAANDADLTPEFPGITDKLSLDKWETLPFPYDSKRIKPRDERFWRDYRTTPKAYVTLEAGQKLWGSRFGRLTSIRMAPEEGADLTASAEAFRKSLLRHLLPARGGLVIDPVKQNALEASSGGTDFAQLFLGFSFFLIVAALLLVGLLFRLNLDRRAAEIGLLTSVGYRRGAIRWLILSEGLLLAGVGAGMGVIAALVYARYLLQLLAALWPGGALQTFLKPHYTMTSLTIGFGASLLVSAITLAWTVRVLGQVAPRSLLAGQTTTESEMGLAKAPRWSWWIAAGALVGGLGLLALSGLVHDHEMQAMTFFGSGTLLLTACLALVSAWMRRSRQRLVDGHGWWSVGRLGRRNAARNPARSLLTAGLLAAAAFLIVVVEAFRREAGAAETGAASASGGFDLLAETDLPLFKDLNSPEGRQEVGEKLLQRFRDELQGDNAAAQERVKEARSLLEQTTFVAFRVKAGDDASCLNLYQPRQPRVLGAPESLIERGGFLFAASTAQKTNPTEQANPWLILRRPGEIAALGEKNTVEWMLKSKLGGRIDLVAEDGREQTVTIEGLLQDSVFQSSLLISEKNFLELYPGHEGYHFFLIAAPPGRAEEVKQLLEKAYGDRGMEVTATAQRLQAFLAVENTYLSTFQALGALGLILGSLGLAVVLLRGVWERRGELALLRALGYRRLTLGWLVLAENGFLLILGLGAGAASALVAVSPHLAASPHELAWKHLIGLLAIVLVVGLSAGALAVASTLRAPLIPALRRE
jgi:ABC-type antimicrobial peptide transport system permease subunit